MPFRISRDLLWAPALSLVVLLTACGKQEQAAEPERAVRTVQLKSEAAGMTYEYAAEVRARIESRLSFRVGGKILSRKVNLGDVVRPGQLLAQLDEQDLLLARTASDAAVFAARTNRDQAAADYKRYIDLQQQGFISAAELERRSNVFKAAQAQLDQAKAQGNVQDNQTTYAQLMADVAGVVTSVDAEPGMVVSAGTPIVRIAQNGPRDVVFSVPEDHLDAFRTAAAQPGALKFTLWGPGQSPRDAVLREVSAAADPVTRTFLVKADVGSLDTKLGQTATVTLKAPRAGPVIKLPLSAVMQEQGKNAVWVLDPKTMMLQSQAVQIGGADGNDVVISGGLQPGLEVVVAGVHVLKAGQKVRRYVAPDAASH
ncbi:efflux RND transporter periplasmic adaptor subunit [Roseateles koreensis]|uniref:Efflux RND transporter periplasmic adaptor subunit n=1 Tax=Roseateles koreensis TaxID=2987526 RepID=A0ABT5KU25_9BURK|nr:efflux RND transporter periplasmic adaptor subunit [Roseateles koreensis]MDC8786342.1 efflux RND transporter periplasmic adaptor subunit [Roseateles koreensis]